MKNPMIAVGSVRQVMAVFYISVKVAVKFADIPDIPCNGGIIVTGRSAEVFIFIL
jgi:hypothetical protein